MATTIVRRIDIDKYAVLNKISYFGNSDSTTFSGTVDISRAEYPNYNNYTQLVVNDSANNQYYLDRSIEMNKKYRYRLFIDDPSLEQQDLSGTWITHIVSYKPLIYNTNVTYNYSNNFFNITWDAIETNKFYDNYTLKNYQIYICKKSINNDLIY